MPHRWRPIIHVARPQRLAVALIARRKADRRRLAAPGRPPPYGPQQPLRGLGRSLRVGLQTLGGGAAFGPAVCVQRQNNATLAVGALFLAPQP